jgi:hypothetical protein
MANSTDPFSASVIPFEVPEQVRAFAEKGVSQARESYTKFKDAAETHNSTVEAVFSTATKALPTIRPSSSISSSRTPTRPSTSRRNW